MKINKLILVGALLASSAAFSAPPRRSDNNPPPPPPPRGELHERLCEGGNCCNFDVDGRTLKYTLRCDHKIKEAELTVGNRRPEVFRLFEHGRLQRDIDPREKLSIHLIYPPKPNVKTRLCERDNCCDVFVDNTSLNYTLRCNKKIMDAELTVGNHHPEVFRLKENGGRVHRDIDPREKMSIHLIYPPKPNVHTRLCDDGNCCELNVNNTSMTYGLRCDRAIQNAELVVGNHRTEVFNISENGGSIGREIDPQERMSIRLYYPTHKSARAKAMDRRH